MSILSTEKLGHNYDGRWLFRDISFGVQPGDRIALVGANGAGKSTLLRILAGREVASEGKVVTEKDIAIGYLEQNPDFQIFTNINSFIFNAENEQQQLISEYERLILSDDVDEKKLTQITDKLSASNAWEYEFKIKTILSRLGITNLNQSIESLSGGQQKRLALAKLLISDPEVYILDEPTNHLDIETIEWLETLLTTSQKTIIFVTHDRYFLDNICTEIRELEDNVLYRHEGKYETFLVRKSEREESNATILQKNKNLLRKELEWMRRQPQARGTKSKSRIDAFHELESKVRTGRTKDTLQLSVEIARQGNSILEVKNISKGFGTKQVIENFSYVFKKGDRIGIAGQNGTGKSTFLNILTGELLPDAGNIIKGETTVFGYYHQLGLELPENVRVIDIVKEVAEYIKMSNGELISASQLLTQFLFPPEKQYGFVSSLSGGEQKRLQLLKILIKNPNFLILDEPSNDLDIDTLNILEEFLEGYPGVLMIVSHDRYLLDKLTEQLFIFTDSASITIYNGNYSDFKTEKLNQEKEEKARNKKVIEKLEPKKEKKISYKEKKELETLETVIPDLESKILALTNQMNTVTDHETLNEIAHNIRSLNSELSLKEDRWIELKEKED
ncbi:ABC-F family ATP-binding cassette domain-containing protein [Albibacterium indicum]|uniref:ABC-F family ATP-binding cassette domain-containing protein n=1 Tax=Albibacterium indicum TaxID=2292082 RepID=UPI000E4BF902|nr:ABC-F family ATP-binding cassette domain-containing protein [Pedobacter indicus]